MAKEELLAYIRQVRSKGYAPAQIQSVLSRAGYPADQIAEAMNASLAPTPQALPVKMGYFKRLKLALFSPRRLFEQIKGEKLGKAFGFFALTMLLFSVLLGGIFFVIYTFFLSFLSQYLPLDVATLGLFGTWGVLGIAAMCVGIFVFSLLSSFIGAALLHLFVKLFRGSGTYTATYQALAYSSAGALFGLLLMLVPVIGSLAAGIWQLVILLFGLSALHGISKKRAFFALVVETLLVGVLAFFAAQYFMFSGIQLAPSIDIFPPPAVPLVCVFTQDALEGTGGWCVDSVEPCFTTKEECDTVANPTLS
ncbi:MAG: Yip1 family protein [Nanoarchaeota archaeon]|nr:Yip1 family protein [Nanoarchaeota archaeon]